MSKFFDDTMQGLLEAVAIEKGNIPMVEKLNMPAPSFVAADPEKKLIEEMVEIRKKENISQSKLAELTGNKQQAISRIEKKEHSPSLKLFYSIIRAMGYDLVIVKNTI